MVLHHVGRFQIFNGDSLVSINVVTRGFMKGVLTLVCNALIVTRYIVFGFLASVAALLAPGKSPLGMSQLLCLGVLETRETNLAALFEPAKEVGKGAVKTFERGIHDHSGQIRMSLLAMTLVLLIEMQVLAR